MGYILPINLEQYRHYHNVVHRKNPHPFLVKPINEPKIKPKLNKENNKKNKEHYFYVKQPRNNYFDKEEKEAGQIDTVFTDVTGKGFYINEQV